MNSREPLIIIAFLYLLLPDLLEAQQPTYSHRYAVDTTYAASAYTSGLHLGDTIYTTGVHAELLGEDTVVRRDFSSLVLHDAQTGEIIKVKELPNPPERLSNAWIDDLIFLQDTIYVLTSIDGGYTAGMFKISKQGEIYEFVDSVITDGYMFRPNVQLLSDNTFLMTYERLIEEDNPVIGMQFSRFNRNSKILMSRTYFENNGLSDIQGQIFYKDGEYIFTGYRSNYYLTDKPYYQTQILGLDSAGNVQWEYRTEPYDQIERGLKTYPTEDGGYIVIAEKGYKEVNGPPDSEYWDFRWSGLVYKLDSQFNRVWETEFEPINPIEVQGGALLDVVEVPDGSGYVAAGYMFFGSTDTIGWEGKAWIFNVSPEGDSLWSRKFNQIGEVYAQNRIQDIQALEDGSLLATGYSLDGDNDFTPPRQQALLLRLNEQGCLVPDCDAVDVSDIPDQQKAILKIYPNPASERLNIFVKAKSRIKGTIQLRTLEGQLIKQFQHHDREVTHLLPVGQYPSGTYLLELVVDGAVVNTRKVVIQH